MWEPQPLTVIRASMACTGINLSYLTFIINYFAGEKNCVFFGEVTDTNMRQLENNPETQKLI
jgi:hypothetical protein